MPISFRPPRIVDSWQRRVPGAPWYVRHAVSTEAEEPSAGYVTLPQSYRYATTPILRAIPTAIPMTFRGMGGVDVMTAIETARRFVAIGVPARLAARYAARALWRLLISA